MRSKYGCHDRKAAENFIGGAPHDASMPIDYFVRVIKGDSKVWVVDTGFDRAEANKRGRHVDRTVGEAVALVGVNEAEVAGVVITHLHYDHCGSHDTFKGARFHLQDREMRYATGRCMCMPALRDSMWRRELNNRRRIRRNARRLLSPTICLVCDPVGGNKR